MHRLIDFTVCLSPGLATLQLPTEDSIIISRYTLTALLLFALGAVRSSVPAISK